jgi:hypothetical protein
MGSERRREAGCAEGRERRACVWMGDGSVVCGPWAREQAGTDAASSRTGREVRKQKEAEVMRRALG